MTYHTAQFGPEGLRWTAGAALSEDGLVWSKARGYEADPSVMSAKQKEFRSWYNHNHHDTGFDSYTKYEGKLLHCYVLCILK